MARESKEGKSAAQQPGARKRGAGGSGGRESRAGQSAAERLNELLPLAEPARAEVHLHATILEVSDPSQLLELASDAGLRPFLLCRLAPAVALVDPGGAERLVETLRRRGYTPKVIR